MVNLNLVAGWLVAAGTRCVSSSSTSSPSFHLVEELDAVPIGWSLLPDLPESDSRITLHFAMRQQNMEEFESLATAVSTPQHKLYGQFMTREEIGEMLKPSENDVQSVLEWLEQSGVDHAKSAHNDWVHINTDISTANKLFDTEFRWFKEDGTESKRLRTLKYSIPSRIAPVLDFIHPTTDFSLFEDTAPPVESWEQPNWVRRSDKLNPAENCTSPFTVPCLRQRYNVGNYTPSSSGQGKSGFVSMYLQNPLQTDLDKFFDTYMPEASGQTWTDVEINDPVNSQDSKSTKEANMDIQALLGMSHPIPTEQYLVGGDNDNRGTVPGFIDLFGPDPTAVNASGAPWVPLVEALLAMDDADLPHTMSISYSGPEATVPMPLAKKVCNGFAQLSARGMSVFVSSGDVGVGKYCFKRDGVDHARFTPRFPSVCPWVTSVGGTWDQSPVKASGISGGGFSDKFPRPQWQDEIIKTFLEEHTPDVDPKLYNSTGRAYPDISAEAIAVMIVNQGAHTTAIGTSVSTPTVAGIFAMINGALVERGRKPMGLINPWLYQGGYQAITDVITGERNAGCRYGWGIPNAEVIPGVGFVAGEGWDPVTGFGNPNFQKIFSMVVGDDGAQG